MSNEFLLKEYELSFEQLRFFDTRQETLLKFVCTLTSATAVAEFAILQFMRGATSSFMLCEAVMSGLVFIATVLILLAMLQNRLYIVFFARQLNAIRGYLMKVAAEGFENNQLFTSTSFSALKPFSVHTAQLFGTALISAMFAAGAVYGIASELPCNLNWGLPMVAGSIVLICEVLGGAIYLHIQGAEPADAAIHHGIAKTPIM